MNNRRKLVIALGAGVLAGPFGSSAQQQGKLWRIGFISSRAGRGPNEEVFRQSMLDLGYVEGQNIAIEWRFSPRNIDEYPEIAAELVRLKVECMVTASFSASLAAKLATPTIPIVMVSVQDDPVRRGLVASLARPGANVTGYVLLGPELAGKRLQLLKEILPGASRIAILWDRNIQGSVSHVKATEAAASVLGVQLQSLDVGDEKGLENAFQAAGRGRAQALVVVGTGFFNIHQARIANLATKAHLPSIYDSSGFVLAGGLMSYGADGGEQFRGAATYVDKILKGTKPADLPVQQPTKFEFFLNLKAAKAIGIKIPGSVLVQATKFIE
ncbi:MAG: ABC transporter substrate-binding protein [Betaproteobacteria bacterium]|nr:ABC transporter substrate-binding protein [Betaproteobacteria bacterium]